MTTIRRQSSFKKRIPIVVVFAVLLIFCAGVTDLVLQKMSGQEPAAVLAIDSANTISSPAWFTQAYQQGVRLYIIHSTAWGTCQPWTRTKLQLQWALAAGLKIAAYTRDPRCYESGIQATAPYTAQLQFFALDIETNPGIPLTSAMVQGVRSLHVRPLIYTNASMWGALNTVSGTEFASVPLWEAEASYSSPSIPLHPTLLHEPPVLFAGWNTALNPRVGVQQYFEHNLNGVNVDISSFRRSFLF